MNKYKLITIFIILAIAGYFLSASFSSNFTKTSAIGEKLVVANVCKPLENKCEVSGKDLKLNIQFKARASYQRLLPITLNSSINSLDEVSMSLVIGDQEMPLEAMKSVGDKKHWEVQLMPFAEVTKDNLKIRLTVSSKEKLYFAEIPISY